MRNIQKLAVALSVVIVLAMPVVGLSLASPKTVVPAHALRMGEGVTVDFLAPLADRTSFYGGSVIPVRVLVIDNDDVPTKGANVTIWVNDMPAKSPGVVDTGNQMKNLRGGMYMFNLDTKSYPAGPGSLPIVIKVSVFVPEDHPVEEEVEISLA